MHDCDSKGHWECEGDLRVRAMTTGRRQMLSLRDGFSCVKNLKDALREESMKDKGPLCSANRMVGEGQSLVGHACHLSMETVSEERTSGLRFLSLPLNTHER